MWHDKENENDHPMIAGWYRVLVAGDSESIDGHKIYDYPDYEEFMFINIDEDGVSGTGPHDEEYEFVIAWYGPLEIPARKVKGR